MGMHSKATLLLICLARCDVLADAVEELAGTYPEEQYRQLAREVVDLLGRIALHLESERLAEGRSNIDPSDAVTHEENG